MTNKHTPGPWLVANAAIFAGNTEVTDPFAGFDTHGKSLPIDEREANARLIAAAPDLLAALQDLHEFTREHSALYRNGISPTDPLYRNVYDAIAKATGHG